MSIEVSVTMVAIEKFVILTFLQNWDKVFFFLPHLIVRTLRMHSRYNNNYRNDEFVAHLVELKLPQALMFEHPIWVKKTFSRRYILFCNFFSSFLKLSQYKICSHSAPERILFYLLLQYIYFGRFANSCCCKRSKE